MVVWKEILPGPGTYWYRDQDTGMPRTITFTPASIRHLHDSGKAMLAAGLSVPVPLEHQPDALPLSATDAAASRLRHNAGWTRDYRLTPKGGLEASLDIADPHLVEKLSTTIRWTSPYITSFTDGQGRAWQNVIAHNALTTRPRITDQQPFPSVQAALSAAQALPHPVLDPTGPVGSLAVVAAGRLLPRSAGGTDLVPARPLAFSLLSGVPLAAAELALLARKKKPAHPEGTSRETAPGKKMAGMPSVPPAGKMAAEGNAVEEAARSPQENEETPGEEVLESIVDADGDIPVWEVIRDLLESEGFELPEGTSADNFAENMYTCLMSRLKEKSREPEEPMPPAEPPTAPPPATPPAGRPPVLAEQPPLYMSQEEIQKIEDPRMRRMAQLSLSLQEHAFAQARSRRLEKVDRLLRRLVPSKREQVRARIEKQLPQAQLSLGTDGKVTDTMEEWLDLLDQAIEGLPDVPHLLTTTSQAVAEVPHPAEYQGEVSPERARAVADELAARGRLPKRAS